MTLTLQTIRLDRCNLDAAFNKHRDDHTLSPVQGGEGVIINPFSWLYWLAIILGAEICPVCGSKNILQQGYPHNHRHHCFDCGKTSMEDGGILCWNVGDSVVMLEDGNLLTGWPEIKKRFPEAGL